MPALRGGRAGRGSVLLQVRVHPPAGGRDASPEARAAPIGSGASRRPSARRGQRISDVLRHSPACDGRSGTAGVDRPDGRSAERQVLYPVREHDRTARGLLSGMPATSGVKRTGRRGRRTGAMVRIAHQRIDDLFALAGRESATGHPELAHRYVVLARRIGTRYNVRLRPEYRELYCRGCSIYWAEGRTVRTRLRAGHRVRTCLACGRERRTPVRSRRVPASSPPPRPEGSARRDEAPPLAIAPEEPDSEPEGEEE